MKILLTGAFGTIGTKMLEKLVASEHDIRCFDIKTRRTRKIARKFRKRFEIRWGDICSDEAVALAVEDRELIIHLAFVLPPISESQLLPAEQVNIEGTKRLLRFAKEQQPPHKVIFASSMAVYGDVRGVPQPLSEEQPVNPVDYYAQHKARCMQLVRESGLEYAILLLAVVPPMDTLAYDPMMYEVPVDCNMEVIHLDDAAQAFVNAITNEKIWNKLWHIGGGPSCRLPYLDFVQKSMINMGIGEIPKEAFGGEKYHSCFINSEASNALLQYQNHSFEDILQDMKENNRVAVFFAKRLSKPIRKFLLKKSPYYHKAKE